MTVLPPGCISLDEAMARLGPLLMGKDWIPELAPHELSLLERERAAQIRDDGLIVPINTMIASQDEKPEVSAVRVRLEEAMWQRQRCKAWLRRNKLAQGQDGAMAVNKRTLEAALALRLGPFCAVPGHLAADHFRVSPSRAWAAGSSRWFRTGRPTAPSGAKSESKQRDSAR